MAWDFNYVERILEIAALAPSDPIESKPVAWLFREILDGEFSEWKAQIEKPFTGKGLWKLGQKYTNEVIPLYTRPSVADAGARDRRGLQTSGAKSTLIQKGLSPKEADAVMMGEGARALKLLVIKRPEKNLNPPGIASSVHGLHCVYCDWSDESYDTKIEHEDDCPIVIGIAALTSPPT